MFRLWYFLSFFYRLLNFIHFSHSSWFYSLWVLYHLKNVFKFLSIFYFIIDFRLFTQTFTFTYSYPHLNEIGISPFAFFFIFVVFLLWLFFYWLQMFLYFFIGIGSQHIFTRYFVCVWPFLILLIFAIIFIYLW